ncbi:MAG: NYN domain-containing protein [Candidatus Paceibacterota bacterium]
MGIYTYLETNLKKPNGEVKGNVDAELVLHTMIEYPNYDKAVIVSGDGDFFCLAKYLLEKDKLKIILAPNEINYSSLFNGLYEKNLTILNFINPLKNKLEKRP